MPHAQLTTLHAVALAIETLAERADGERLLAGSGIAVADLQRPQRRIGVDQERQVFLNATRQRHDLGLALGRRMHVSCYGLLGYGLLSAATLGQALELRVYNWADYIAPEVPKTFEKQSGIQLTWDVFDTNEALGSVDVSFTAAPVPVLARDKARVAGLTGVSPRRATPYCAKTATGPAGCARNGLRRRCRLCQGNNHWLQPAPSRRPFLARTRGGHPRLANETSTDPRGQAAHRQFRL